MYEVKLVTYCEGPDERDEWYIADMFGEYESLKTAHELAATLVARYSEFILLYCATHECDGVSFDVVDTKSNEAIAAYELAADGTTTTWHENECHEWRLV